MTPALKIKLLINKKEVAIRKFFSIKNKYEPLFSNEGFDANFENLIVWDVESDDKKSSISLKKELKPKSLKVNLDLSFDSDVVSEIEGRYVEIYPNSRNIDFDIEKQIRDYRRIETKKIPDIRKKEMMMNRKAFEKMIKEIDVRLVEKEKMQDLMIEEQIILDDEQSHDPKEITDSLIERVHSGQAIIEGHQAETIDEQARIDASHMRKIATQYVENENKDIIDIKHEGIPLAEKSLIKSLQEKHMYFYNLLSRIQETHAPNDFASAYHIQDRISYLLTNQTLLYKNLAIQLIDYLTKINSKLDSYYKEITAKQTDLKKMNEQIQRFNEYERKTNDQFVQAKEEKEFLKEDIENLENNSEDL